MKGQLLLPEMGLIVLCNGLECFLKKVCMSSRSFVIVDVAKKTIIGNLKTSYTRRRLSS